MSVLVDDLLLLARLDQGRPIASEAVALRPLVADAVDAVRAVEPQRHLSLDARYGLLVRGDSGRIRQAVDNLLRNAVVHTPPDSPVAVKVVTVGSVARLSVADEGPGLSPDEAEHVFDRFFQADLSRTGQGTGLGLSIVAAIAEAHGGRTWVESTPGVGSTFYFELPIDTATDTPEPEPRSVTEPEETAPRGGEHAWFGVTG
jgi:two-component system OmpR family sensor kinase